MSVTISVVCFKCKTLANGEHPLMLRISQNKKRTMKSLGISINSKHWDFNKEEPKPKCPNRELIQNIILKIKAEYQSKILEKRSNDEEFTASSLINERRKDIKAQTVEEFYLSLINELKEKGQIGTSYAYLNSYNTLKSFYKEDKLDFTFSYIDITFLRDFEDWMRQKKNKDTTLSYHFRTLRAVFNKAIEAKIVAKGKNPFSEFKLSHLNTKTQKRALSKVDILKIINTDCNKKDELRQLSQDIFTFSYLCGGISFIDIANLTSKNIVDGRLLYKRQKTHGDINLILSSKAKSIIKKHSKNASGYLFPILDNKRHITPMQKNNRIHKICHQVNTELRALGKELKIKAEVTTYVARHSFATILKKSGVNIGVISEALGHQNIKTTQIYLSRFDNEQIDEAMKNLL